MYDEYFHNNKILKITISENIIIQKQAKNIIIFTFIYSWNGFNVNVKVLFLFSFALIMIKKKS